MVSGLPKVFRVFRRGVFFESQDVVERLIEGIVAVILEDSIRPALAPGSNSTCQRPVTATLSPSRRGRVAGRSRGYFHLSSRAPSLPVWRESNRLLPHRSSRDLWGAFFPRRSIRTRRPAGARGPGRGCAFRHSCGRALRLTSLVSASHSELGAARYSSRSCSRLAPAAGVISTVHCDATFSQILPQGLGAARFSPVDPFGHDRVGLVLGDPVRILQDLSFRRAKVHAFRSNPALDSQGFQVRGGSRGAAALFSTNWHRAASPLLLGSHGRAGAGDAVPSASATHA